MGKAGTFIKVSLFVSLVLCLQIGLPYRGLCQGGKSGESAATVFKQTLEEQGIEAAVAKFREMKADTSGAYTLDVRELLFTARELVWKEKQDDAIELYKLIVEVYPKSPWPWFDLGSLYLFACDKTQANKCLSKSLELNPQNTYAKWILENIDELVGIVKIQIQNKDKYAPGQNTGIQGPYLGEEPPDRTPKVFANGILNSTDNEFSISFSPDGKEIYFSRTGVGVMVCRWEKEGWTAPQLVELAGDSLVCDEANVSPDGSMILFNARPTIFDNREICRAQRAGDGWGRPEKLFEGMYATSSLDGAIYYTVPSGQPDIGVIGKRRPTDEGYSEPEVLGGGVNTRFVDAHPFIAPDESFIVFDSSREGGNRLYVCFLQADGSWGEAVCLNDHLDIPPFVGQPALTPDGKYLFYSLHGDMYWVGVGILDDLRPE